MPKLKFTFTILLFTFLYLNLNAQADDNIIWATFKAQKNLDKKTSVALTPIFRINEDISNYQNMSIDYSVKRKFGKGWSAQLLGRTWFIPDQSRRQFIWVDVGYGKKIGVFQASSSVRLHWALDVHDRNDPDFIRWKTTLALMNLGKIKPFIAIEPWFRLNDGGEYQRIRYEPGLGYKISDNLNFTAVFRREISANLEPGFIFNQYVITLTYTFPDRKE